MLFMVSTQSRCYYDSLRNKRFRVSILLSAVLAGRIHNSVATDMLMTALVYSLSRYVKIAHNLVGIKCCIHVYSHASCTEQQSLVALFCIASNKGVCSSSDLLEKVIDLLKQTFFLN